MLLCMPLLNMRVSLDKPFLGSEGVSGCGVVGTLEWEVKWKLGESVLHTLLMRC